MTRVATKNLAKYDIRVNALPPGFLEGGI